MRIPRIYHPAPLAVGDVLDVSEDAAHHLSRVLRMTTDAPLELFDGSNQVFSARLSLVDKKTVEARVLSVRTEDRESPLHLHLGQVMSRGEKMEFTIQKSIELGVNVIKPLFSARCGVKLEGERLEKKLQQWRKIAIGACEQCGRNRLAEIHPAMTLEAWCAEQHAGLKLNLHPRAEQRIKYAAAAGGRYSPADRAGRRPVGGGNCIDRQLWIYRYSAGATRVTY